MNLIAPINQLGYGIAALNILKELSKVNNVSLFPIGPISVTNQDDMDCVKKSLDNSQFFDVKQPCLKIWHQHDMAQFVTSAKRIGMPFFELDTFNSREIHHLGSLDKLFVCSHWAKKVCLRQIMLSEKDISVIPLGVDCNIFKPSAMNESDKTIFFNCGKWEIRKGHDILIDIFCEAFNPDDNVELWMMCSNPFLKQHEAQEWADLYHKSKLGDKVRLLERAETQQEVYNTMTKADCGVFPYRAEGWNLELLEMLACGKHVITTNYSAHTEFCNKENSRLVDINEREVAYDGKWFTGTGKWAKICPKTRKQLVEHLRAVHEEKQKGKLEVNNEGIKTASLFSWENTSRKILQHV